MKKITKIIIVVAGVFLAVFLFNAPGASAKSFKGHINTIKDMLEGGQYNALTNQYLTASVKTGEWWRKYSVMPKETAKKKYLKPYAFKSIEASEMEKGQWEIYFPETAASKYGAVFAKLLNKKTGQVLKGSDGTARMELFPIVLQGGQVKIFGIYKSTYKNLFVAF